MYIAQLRIVNFRGIKFADINLPLHSVLVGPNNTGKTTIIEALALIAGRDRMIRTLTEHDFFGSNPTEPDRIKIVATICGFSPNDHLAHLDWFEDRRGIIKYLNPATQKLSVEKGADKDLLACQIAFVARFDRESLEVETIRYFYDDDDNHDVFADDLTVARVPASIIRDIGFFLIPANRSWDRMISFGSELFRRVLASLEGPPTESILAERDRLRNPTNRLESDQRMVSIVSNVNSEIKSLFGAAKDLRLLITSTDSEGVLDAVMPHFTGGGNALVPAKREGSGLVSLQSLFLLLHFGQERVKKGNSFVMALEEPELHLPPSIQRRILRRLQSLSTQTIISTHSPLIAGFADPTSLLAVRNAAGTVTATPLRKTAVDKATPNAVRTIFQLNRVETVGAIMNEVLLIPEGRLDFEWLFRLLRLVELDTKRRSGAMFGSKIGVIPTPDSQVACVVEALAPVHPSIFALVDGDEEGKKYSKTSSSSRAYQGDSSLAR